MLQSAEFSPDGKLLATVERGSAEVQLRETVSWRRLPSPAADGAANALVRGLAFHPNARLLAIQLQDSVVLWDLAKRRRVAKIESADSVARTLVFSPGGSRLVVIDKQGTLAMYGVKTDPAGNVRLIAEPNWRTPPVNQRVTPVFSRDGTRLAFGVNDGVSVIALAANRETARIAQAAEALAFAPDGDALLTGNHDGGIARWPGGANETLRLPHPGVATRLALSPDGNWLAAMDKAGALRVFDTAERRELAQLAAAEAGAQVDFSRDGRWLLLTSDHRVRVTDTRSWTEVLRHDTDDWISDHVMLTPEGGWLVISAGARVHRYATGSWHAAPPIAVLADAFLVSPDGKRLATHSEMSYAHGLGLQHPSMTRVWDMSSGDALAWLSHEDTDRRLTMFGAFKRAPAVSGPWTTASAGGDVALANAAQAWPKLRTLAEWRQPPDKPWLATIDARGAALAAAYVARARSASGETDIANAFSANGRWLASAGADEVVRLWLAPTSDLIADACTRIGRNLTKEEWKQHFGDEPRRRTCSELP